MEPFKKPVLCALNMPVSGIKIVGNWKKHLEMALKGTGNGPKIFEAIGFSLAEKFSQIKKNDKINIALNLKEGEWNGNKKIQLKIIYLKNIL
ncbi:hypothetical protein HY797_01715 [Candidatus Falkowbacteria bacterium]|nr:hypothetical protein [Candidatus Falkowbacteria bacterium]